MNTENSNATQPFISTAEAAKYLRISKSTLYHLTSTGKIRHYKPAGKLVYFRVADLDDYVMSAEVKPQHEIDAEAARLIIGRRGKGRAK